MAFFLGAFYYELLLQAFLHRQFVTGFALQTLVDERFRQRLVVMSTGAVNMAVLKFFCCGLANIGDSDIEVEVFAC